MITIWKRFWGLNVKRLSARGKAYIQPVGRGIVFTNGKYKDKYISDLIEELNDGEGHGHLRITAEWIPDNEHEI